MKSAYPHRILVVDNDKNSHTIFKTVLTKTGIKGVFLTDAEAAIKKISKKKLFSAIITARRHGSMTGTDLLAKARQQTPDTIRVLMTSHSKIETVIQAINKGAIQNYIVKPLTEANVDIAVHSCIRQFNLFLEEKKLSEKVKKQSRALYLKDRELMKNSKKHDKSIQNLDKKIHSLKKAVKILTQESIQVPDTIVDIIENCVKSDDGISQNKIKTLFETSVRDLFSQFNELSYRNGFEMPPMKGDL